MYVSFGASLTHDPSSTRRAPTYFSQSEIILFSVGKIVRCFVQRRIPHLSVQVDRVNNYFFLVQLIQSRDELTIENTLTRLFNCNIIPRI